MWRPLRTGNYRNATLNGRLEAQALSVPSTVTTRTTGTHSLEINDNAFLTSLGTAERNEGQIRLAQSTVQTFKGIAIGIRLAEKEFVSQQIQTFINLKAFGDNKNISEKLMYTAYLAILDKKEEDDTTYTSDKHIILPLEIHHSNGYHVSGTLESTTILRQDDSVKNIDDSAGLALILLIFNPSPGSITVRCHADFAIQRYEKDIITHDPSR